MAAGWEGAWELGGLQVCEEQLVARAWEQAHGLRALLLVLLFTVSYPRGRWHCSHKPYVADAPGQLGRGSSIRCLCTQVGRPKSCVAAAPPKQSCLFLKQLGDAVKEVGKVQLGLFLIPCV